jgi:hypothetical protein
VPFEAPIQTIPVHPATPGFVAQDEDATTPTEKLLLNRIKELEEIILLDNLLIANYAKAEAELQDKLDKANAALKDMLQLALDTHTPTAPLPGETPRQTMVREVVAEMNKRDLSNRSEADRRAMLADRR